MASNDLTIRGNHDRWVAGPDPAQMGASDWYAFSQLNRDHRCWLVTLPISANADHGILACHGTPTDDNQYLTEEVSGCRLVPSHPSSIRERLGEVQARVVLCGHSHRQHLFELPDGRLILNPGSVGCPSYDDPDNDPHMSEAGSPQTRYAILNVDEQQVSGELISIGYDWKAAAARAEKNGRPEWAFGLRTGCFGSAPESF
jgi:predicted phosphodiesterase